MDLELNSEQRLIIDAIKVLFERHAGPARARNLNFGLDRTIVDKLISSGYLDSSADTGTSRNKLIASLIVEKAVEYVVSAPVGARALVAPYLGLTDAPSTIALANGNGSVVRYGNEADGIVMLETGTVRLLDRNDVEAEPIESRMSYPLAVVTALPSKGRLIAVPDAAGRLTRAWRALIAAELAGAMVAAVECARSYVAVRRQFGRRIASFQAVQHNLARAYIAAQGAMWLARRSAWDLDDHLQAAIAACYATGVAQDVFDTVHQVVGAMGFTTEFDLHLWSMRLPVLLAELGGPRAHATAVSRIRRASQQYSNVSGINTFQGERA
jgi:hypothetical protein